MKVIHNRYIPLRGFLAINLFGFIFVRHGTRLGFRDMNHEYIHTLQQRELLFVFFYVWYVTEWLLRLAVYRNPMRAYRSLLFEREAYMHQYDMDYRRRRKHFAWIGRK